MPGSRGDEFGFKKGIRMNDFDDAKHQVSADRLIKDFKVVVADAEGLLRATADELGESLGEKVREARARLSSSLDAAKATSESLETKAMEGLQATDRVIRKNPYQAIGVALGAGLLLGILVSRR